MDGWMDGWNWYQWRRRRYMAYIHKIALHCYVLLIRHTGVDTDKEKYSMGFLSKDLVSYSFVYVLFQ